ARETRLSVSSSSAAALCLSSRALFVSASLTVVRPSGSSMRRFLAVAAAILHFGVRGVGDLLRVRLRRAVEFQPVAERKVIDHVHHLELQPARLVGVAVPERHDAALLL